MLNIHSNLLNGMEYTPVPFSIKTPRAGRGTGRRAYAWSEKLLLDLALVGNGVDLGLDMGETSWLSDPKGDRSHQMHVPTV